LTHSTSPRAEAPSSRRKVAAFLLAAIFSLPFSNATSYRTRAVAAATSSWPASNYFTFFRFSARGDVAFFFFLVIVGDVAHPTFARFHYKQTFPSFPLLSVFFFFPFGAKPVVKDKSFSQSVIELGSAYTK
jgi:hypothetical protein